MGEPRLTGTSRAARRARGLSTRAIGEETEMALSNRQTFISGITLLIEGRRSRNRTVNV